MSLCTYLVFLFSDLCFLSLEMSQNQPKTTGHGFHLNYLKDRVRLLLGSIMVYAYVKLVKMFLWIMFLQLWHGI